ncbi:Alpha/Beta hydrolase protein [Gongronella butleri]|nr:Alpha/Beta hydrolase protein [Gongronella butleri]
MSPRPAYSLPPEPLKAFLAYAKVSEDDADAALSNPELIRAFVHENAAKLPKPHVDRQSFSIPTKDGSLNIVVIRPPDTLGKILPIVLYIHGGGFLVGNIDTHGLLPMEVALRAKAVVIHVDYALSPIQHPVALNQCYEAFQWLLANADSIGGDIDRLIIMGDSAGGNLATSVAGLAKERGESAIKAQVLMYPMMGTDFNTESYEKFKDDVWLPRTKMQFMWDLHLTEEAKTDRYAVPLLTTKEELQGLPPAFVVSCANDVLRDDAEIYAKMLREAGIETLAVRYDDVGHSFLTTSPTLTLAGEACVDQIVSYLNKKW